MSSLSPTGQATAARSSRPRRSRSTTSALRRRLANRRRAEGAPTRSRSREAMRQTRRSRSQEPMAHLCSTSSSTPSRHQRLRFLTVPIAGNGWPLGQLALRSARRAATGDADGRQRSVVQPRPCPARPQPQPHGVRVRSQPQGDLTCQRAGVAGVVDDADVQLRDHALAGAQRAPDRHASSRGESQPHGHGVALGDRRRDARQATRRAHRGPQRPDGRPCRWRGSSRVGTRS